MTDTTKLINYIRIRVAANESKPDDAVLLSSDHYDHPRAGNLTIGEVRRAVEEIERMQDELASFKADCEALNAMLRERGIGQGEIDNTAAELTELKQKLAAAERSLSLETSIFKASQCEVKRLHVALDDALVTLAGAKIPTPEKTYKREPHCLVGDIRKLVKERDDAKQQLASQRTSWEAESAQMLDSFKAHQESLSKRVERANKAREAAEQETIRLAEQLAAATQRAEAAEKECDQWHRSFDAQNGEIRRLSDERGDLDDAVERLREIGKLIGCGHCDHADDRSRLVNCVSEEIERLTAERDALARSFFIRDENGHSLFGTDGEPLTVADQLEDVTAERNDANVKLACEEGARQQLTERLREERPDWKEPEPTQWTSPLPPHSLKQIVYGVAEIIIADAVGPAGPDEHTAAATIERELPYLCEAYLRKWNCRAVPIDDPPPPAATTPTGQPIVRAELEAAKERVRPHVMRARESELSVPEGPVGPTPAEQSPVGFGEFRRTVNHFGNPAITLPGTRTVISLGHSKAGVHLSADARDSDGRFIANTTIAYLTKDGLALNDTLGGLCEEWGFPIDNGHVRVLRDPDDEAASQPAPSEQPSVPPTLTPDEWLAACHEWRDRCERLAGLEIVANGFCAEIIDLKAECNQLRAAIARETAARQAAESEQITLEEFRRRAAQLAWDMQGNIDGGTSIGNAIESLSLPERMVGPTPAVGIAGVPVEVCEPFAKWVKLGIDPQAIELPDDHDWFVSDDLRITVGESREFITAVDAAKQTMTGERKYTYREYQERFSRQATEESDDPREVGRDLARKIINGLDAPAATSPGEMRQTEAEQAEIDGAVADFTERPSVPPKPTSPDEWQTTCHKWQVKYLRLTKANKRLTADRDSMLEKAAELRDECDKLVKELRLRQAADAELARIREALAGLNEDSPDKWLCAHGWHPAFLGYVKPEISPYTLPFGHAIAAEVAAIVAPRDAWPR